MRTRMSSIKLACLRSKISIRHGPIESMWDLRPFARVIGSQFFSTRLRLLARGSGAARLISRLPGRVAGLFFPTPKKGDQDN